eukprot:gene12257-12395_t
MPLTAEQSRRRALYMSKYQQQQQQLPSAPPELSEGQPCQAPHAASRPLRARPASHPQTAQWIERDLQAVLLTEAVEVIKQHVLGLLRSVQAAGAKAARNGRPMPGVSSMYGTKEGFMANMTQSIAGFMPDHAQTFAEELWDFLHSGLSVAAYDGMVFGEGIVACIGQQRDFDVVNFLLTTSSRPTAHRATSSSVGGRLSSSTAAGPARCTRSILTAAGSKGTASTDPTAARTQAAAAAEAGQNPLQIAAAHDTLQSEEEQQQQGTAERPRRRVSGSHNRSLGMDKLQSEYEALQQKLALLKRDTNRDNGRLQQSTPMSALQAHKVLDSAAPGTATAAACITTAPALAPDSMLSGAAAARCHSTNNDTGPLGSLAGLQNCDNLQLSCSIPDAAGVIQALHLIDKYPGSRLAQLAGSIFSSSEFLQQCEQGLSAQLQRTRDGATAQSRITELAGLVKVLRRCLRDMTSKSSNYVEQCVKAEKEMNQELEKARLDAETSLKRLEAEAALARAAAAQTEATYKAERAAWVTSLDAQKFEVARLQREVEGLEEQRTRAREDAKRSEAARQQLDLEIKELRKASGQQLREVQVTQGEAVKQLRGERQQAERKEAQLRADNEQLEASLVAANGKLAKVQQQLDSLTQLQENLQASLQGKQSAEAELMTQLSQTRSDLSAAETSLAAAVADRGQLQQEVNNLRDQQMLLASDLKLKTSRLEAAQQQLGSEAEEHEAERALQQKQLEQLKVENEEVHAKLASLAAEQESAVQQLAAASSENAALEATVQELRQQHDKLVAQQSCLQAQVLEVQAALEEAEARSGELTGALSAAQSALEEARAKSAEQASRLAHLESEFEALQEVMGEGEQRDIVGRLLGRISNLQAAAAAAEATRRTLHNQMVELRGNEHHFSFDKVFAPGTSQQQVFDSVSELVQSALDGYHVCLFSYGQTGAGKTYTMSGGSSADQQGIMPRSVNQILESVAQLTEQEWRYELSASCIEVYNNTLRDLLAEGAGSKPEAGRIGDASAIKHDAAGGHTCVIGANRVPVTDAGSAAALMARAQEARACEATAMNAVSSRSHCVFMLYISASHAASSTSLTGSLCLVDLAGSERLDRSMVEDLRKREACSINQSLSALGDVFAALSSKSSHVPYRNSKLTYLLQPCLGGHGKTLMFVHINPEPASAQESLCSLKFAAKVNGCETAAKGGARRNVTSGGTLQLSAQEAPGAADGSAAAACALGTKRPAAAGQTLCAAGPKRSKLG